MKRWLLGSLLLALVALPACGGSAQRAGTRSVLTDYNHDEFATSMFGFFPRTVDVHPGDTVDFHQEWTGEPHTVTFGTALNQLETVFRPYLAGEAQLTPQETPEQTAAEQSVPSVFGDHDSVNQTAAAPCYVAAGGTIPTDGKKCLTSTALPFTGREVFYNSGFIPYEGNAGNHFKLKLAKNIAPGSYFYFCLLHGVTMGGYVNVKSASTRIASQVDVNRRARAEIDKALPRYRVALQRAKQDSGATTGDIVAGAFSAHVPGAFDLPFGSVDEFAPKAFHARVGQKVTWIVPDGPGHTISFGVPRYLPAVEIQHDGTVRLNPLTYQPQGGSPTPPRAAQNSAEGAPANGPAFTPIDAGRYDGSFFLSSGYPDGPILYSVTFTKAATYDYACLLHPRMVGKVVVS